MGASFVRLKMQKRRSVAEIDFTKWPAMFVRRNSPAWKAIIRAIQEGPIVPGQIFPVSDAEFESLKEDVLALEPEKALDRV